MMLSHSLHRVAGPLIGVCATFAVWAAAAGSLSPPSEKPILTISGKIELTNEGDVAKFDRAMLEALGTVSIETTTPWHKGPQKFEGVLLDKLMKYLGAKGDRVVAVALNDYVTEIPMEDLATHRPILALKRNGEYMPISDKGPLFIVYDYDSNPQLKSQTYYGRSAWQVRLLIVK